MTQTEPKQLDDFEGNPVIAAKVEIPDAAGGLREAMAVDPVTLHTGDEVHIVLHCRVKKIRFEPAKVKKGAEEALARVHVFETIEAAFIDADQVADHVRENVDRVRREVERLAGVQRLDDALEDNDEPDEDDVERAAELVKAHEMGLHPHAAVVGCTACDEREQDRTGDQRKDLQ